MKRVWFITDTHFGVRANSVEWMDIQHDYFYNFFIPLVRQHYQPGDVLFHLGDVFDNRQAINIKALNMGIEIFEELSKIFKDGIFIICGNHDIFNKSTNDINSLKALKWIPNVTVFEEPAEVKVGGATFVMMPWRKDYHAEREFINSFKGKFVEYLCCHADIAGMKFNSNTLVEHGCTATEYAGFGRVYSGHIHYAQRFGNITMLGSPYQITRADRGNTKTVVLLDPATGTEQEFDNKHSPKFISTQFKDLLSKTPAQIGELFENNFVDVFIDAGLLMKVPINTFIEEIPKTYRRIDLQIITSENKTVVVDSDNVGQSLDMLKLIGLYVNSTAYDAGMKKTMTKELTDLYHKAEQSTLQSA